MRKVCTLLVLCAFAIQSFAASIAPPRKASDVFLPIGTPGQQISLLELSRIDVKTFETRSARHLNVFDRMGFKMAQRHLRNSIKADGTVNSKKLERYMSSGDHSTGFHIGGFALGFFCGLIGVLIAYVINDDNKRNRVKWAWIGFASFMVIYIALLVIVLSQMTAV